MVPIPPTGHWWTIPVLLLAAARSGLLEEVIVCGYLLRRLDQLGWSPTKALWTSALLRGAYHLYQGFGGFFGNLALGLFFGRLYQLRGRTTPLVIALPDRAAAASATRPPRPRLVAPGLGTRVIHRCRFAVVSDRHDCHNPPREEGCRWNQPS